MGVVAVWKVAIAVAVAGAGWCVAVLVASAGALFAAGSGFGAGGSCEDVVEGVAGVVVEGEGGEGVGA